MNKKIGFLIISLFMASLFIFGCSDNRALFDELSTNRLKVVLKGTYETNGPQANAIPFNPRAQSLNNLITSLPGVIYDDSIYLLDNDDEPGVSLPATDENNFSVKYPTRFMIDISHMNLAKDEFCSKRQALSISLSDDHAFFNGTGILLENSDPKHLRGYSFLRIYTRKMLFNEAREYEFGASGWQVSSDDEFTNGLYEVYFNEKKTQGYDFNLLQLNSYYDSLRKEAGHINRVYPIVVPILNPFTFDRNYDSMVLEVRMMVKNFIKKYETTSNRDSTTRVVHFWGFSDWLRDVKRGEYDMGRNLVAVARCYIPEKVGRIEGSAARASYVIAIPAGESLTKYTLVDPSGSPSMSGTITDHDASTDVYTLNTGATDFTDTNTSPNYLAKTGDIIDIGGNSEYIVDVTSSEILFFSTASLTISGNYNFSVYPSSDRDQNPCDLPVKPTRVGKGINQYIDYYLNLEKYRSDFNAAYPSCDNASYDNPFEYYKEAWLNYEDSVKSYYLPPLAAYAPSGPYTLENVMPGDYEIYVTNIADPAADARYGRLFYSNEFNYVTTVTVETGQTETVNVP